MHNIQLAASQIVQQVLAEGRNLNQVLEESLRRKVVWTPAQRAALQDLSYGVCVITTSCALLGLLLHKPMLDHASTMCCWWRCTSCNTAKPRSMPWSIMRCAPPKC